MTITHKNLFSFTFLKIPNLYKVLIVCLLAPIAMEILLCCCSAQKIGMESGKQINRKCASDLLLQIYKIKKLLSGCESSFYINA
jgi:hypothetical protein